MKSLTRMSKFISPLFTYLEDIIMGAIAKTAEQQARKEILEQAEQINQVADDMEKTRTKLQSEEIVAELVSSLLLPEVQKITMRANVKRFQWKHFLAAHRIIHGKSELVMEQNPNAQPEEEEILADRRHQDPLHIERPSSAERLSSRPPSEQAQPSSRPAPGKSDSGSPKLPVRNPDSRRKTGRRVRARLSLDPTPHPLGPLSSLRILATLMETFNDKKVIRSYDLIFQKTNLKLVSTISTCVAKIG